MTNLQMIFALVAALVVIATMAGLGVVLALAMAREDAAGVAAAGDVRPFVSGWTLLMRAFSRRCPRCGRGRIFRSYFEMNPECEQCGAVFWVDRGEWLGAFVIDWACATGSAIVLWAVLEFAFPRLSQIAVIVLISICVIASLFATFPWSRSLWTVFLYLAGSMGERPASAGSDARRPAAARSRGLGRKVGR